MAEKIYKQVLSRKGLSKIEARVQKSQTFNGESIRFAPIYDSGCSFGRELTDERVTQLLGNQEQIEAYVKRGESEIHWEKEKVSHFVLLEKLLNEEDFSELVKNTLKRVFERFNEQAINELIMNVDVDLPAACNSVKIPEERKQLMCKLVFSRFNSLKALILDNK